MISYMSLGANLTGKFFYRRIKNLWWNPAYTKKKYIDILVW